MTKGVVRSARGDMVDFDLLKIKQQMVNIPKPIVVEARENFIDNKFKRQIKRQVVEAISLVPIEEPVSDVISAELDMIEPKLKENKGK